MAALTIRTKTDFEGMAIVARSYNDSVRVPIDLSRTPAANQGVAAAALMSKIGRTFRGATIVLGDRGNAATFKV